MTFLPMENSDHVSVSIDVPSYLQRNALNSNINGVIRPVLNFFFFFLRYNFTSTKKHNQYIGFFFVFFFQDKILSTLNTLVFFRIRFYIKCRFKVNLVLFIYMYFYLNATVKKIYHDGFNS